MNDKELQNQMNKLSETLTGHMMSRLENDKIIAVALKGIEDTTKNTLDQAKLTNGRVTGHDNVFNEIKPKIDVLYNDYLEKSKNTKENSKAWKHYAIAIGILIISIILNKLGIINIHLPTF